MIRAFVGAGGKTTLIHQQAAFFRAEGKRVFVTTSTHMFIEPDTLLTDSAQDIIRQLERTGYAMAGIPEGEKIRSLSPETYRRVCEYADVVLVEADGSNRKPVKYPKAGEPVIYDNVEDIVVVCGLHAIGKPVQEAAHRLELVKRRLGATEETLLTLEHLQKLTLEGYVRPLGEQHPGVKISVYAAGGTQAEREAFLREMKKEGCL